MSYPPAADVYLFVCLFVYIAFHFLAQIGLDLMMSLPQAHRCQDCMHRPLTLLSSQILLLAQNGKVLVGSSQLSPLSTIVRLRPR